MAKVLLNCLLASGSILSYPHLEVLASLCSWYLLHQLLARSSGFGHKTSGLWTIFEFWMRQVVARGAAFYFCCAVEEGEFSH